MILIDYGLIGLSGLLIYELLEKVNFSPPRIKSPYILYCGKIPFNMKLTPHILVSGLSGQGKSMFVQSLLIGRDDIKVTLLNVFRDDMEGITYSIVTKEFELMKLEQFKQYNLQLQLTNGKYGMKLDIVGINE